MYPDYRDGDFVVINEIPICLKRLTKGDVIIFNHHYYGILIKRIDLVMPGGEFFVSGTHENSLNSNKLGIITMSDIKGKVIWHIHKP